MRIVSAAALSGALLCACSGGGGGSAPAGSASAPTPVPTAAPANIIDPPAGSIYLGAFVNTSQNPIPLTSDMTAFEAQVGRKMVLTQHYYGFFETFPNAVEQFDVSEGRVPIESWGCAVSNASIAAGSQDAAISTRAAALRKFGHPIFLRFMWEMNTPSNANYRAACYDPVTDDPNGVFSPSEFIAAWRHIHALFLAAGATNVIWLWNPAGSPDGTPYYPGDAYVDWVGVDVYDYGVGTLSATYQNPYTELAAFGKPMMVAETGALATNQTAFLTGAATTLQSRFPLVHAWVYFDAVGSSYDWRLTGSGLTAFAGMASAPYFAALPPI